MEKDILNFAEDIQVEPVHWLWYPYIPQGKITIVQGQSGIGKTMLMLNIASALSNGEPLPGDIDLREPINIIYNTAEDGLGDTIKPCLLAAGADCTKINTINERITTLSMTDERLEMCVTETEAKLLILDPIQAYLGTNVDMNKANEICPIFAHLGRMAQDNQCAVVLIGHQGKNPLYSELHSLLGSSDQPAAARSVLTVVPSRNNQSLCQINHTKCSLARRGKSLTYVINDHGRIEWGDFVESNDMEAEEKVTKTEAAKEFLCDFLATGSRLQNDVVTAATEIGIAERTLNKAKAELQIKSYRKDNKWLWLL